MCAQAAKVDNFRAVLRTMSAKLAARATLAIPSASEVDEASTIRGVFTRPDDELSETGAAGVVPTAYVSRLLKFFGCSREVYTVAYVYVDRLLRKHPNFVIQACSVNEMLLASVVLALKWHEEVCDQYPDAHYALFGGVQLKKLQQLEARFLELLGWELHVNSSEFCMHSSIVVAMQEQKEEEDACKGHLDADDDDECFSGRPLWGLQSYWTPSACDAPQGRVMHCDAEEDACSIYSMPDGEDCLPGKPLWGDQSYRMNSFCSTSAGSPSANGKEEGECGNAEFENEDCLPGRPLWSARSFRVPSRCSTSPGTSLPESEAEEDENDNDDDEDDDDDECLPGRPLWGAKSYTAPAFDDTPAFEDTPTGSHKQINSATNARIHSKQGIGVNNDCGLPFSGGYVAGILDSRFVEGESGNGPTLTCVEEWSSCHAIHVIGGEDNITISPTFTGAWRAPFQQEKEGLPQLFKCSTKQAPTAACLESRVRNHDPCLPWLLGGNNDPMLLSPHNSKSPQQQRGQRQQFKAWEDNTCFYRSG